MSRARFLASLAGHVPWVGAQLVTEAAALRTFARREARAGEHPWGMRHERVGPDWLTGVLTSNGRLAPEHRVERMTVERFGEVGQMSVVFRVRPEYSEGAEGPATLVLKSTAAEMKNRVFNAVFGVFETEVRAYNLPDPERGLLRPRCWYTGQHAVTRAALLLIDDLTGWRCIPALEKLTPDEAFRVVRALAVHQARWWNEPTLRERGFRDTLRMSVETTGPMFSLAWPKARTIMSALVDADILALLGEYVRKQESLCRSMVEGDTTLVHGDMNTNNLFFDDEGDRVCVIDWQAAHVGHWSEDLAYLLMMGLSAEDLAVHEEALLAAHREALAGEGIVLDEEAYEREYPLGLLAAAGILILAAVVIDPKKDPELYERYRKTITEWSTAARRRGVDAWLAKFA